MDDPFELPDSDFFDLSSTSSLRTDEQFIPNTGKLPRDPIGKRRLECFDVNATKTHIPTSSRSDASNFVDYNITLQDHTMQFCHPWPWDQSVVQLETHPLKTSGFVAQDTHRETQEAYITTTTTQPLTIINDNTKLKQFLTAVDTRKDSVFQNPLPPYMELQREMSTPTTYQMPFPNPIKLQSPSIRQPELQLRFSPKVESQRQPQENPNHTLLGLSKEASPSTVVYPKLNMIIDPYSGKSQSSFEGQSSANYTKASACNWLDKEGIYFVATLNPTRTIAKIKKQFSNYKFIHCSSKQSLDSVLRCVLEQGKSEVIIINSNNYPIDRFAHLMGYLQFLKFKRAVIYNSGGMLSEVFYKMLQNESVCELIFDEITWNEIPSHVQQQLTNMPVIFQNIICALKIFIPDAYTDEYKLLTSALSPEILFQLAKYEHPVLCENTLTHLPTFYVTRQLSEWILTKDNDQPKITEAELIEKLCKKFTSCAVGISGGIASGKTSLLIKLGTLLLTRNIESLKTQRPKLVQYFNFSKVLKLLEAKNITSKNELTEELVIELISAIISDNMFTQQYLHLPDVNCELLLDDIDKIPDCYLDLSLTFLSMVQKNSSLGSKIRLWFATRPTVINVLQQQLDIKCYNAVNLDSHYATYFLGTLDKSSGIQKELLAKSSCGKSFKELCSNKLSEFERNFLQTPLYYHMLAQSHFEHTEILLSPKIGIPASKLYANFITQRTENSLQESRHRKSGLLKFYQKLAMQKLYPQYVKHFGNYFNDSGMRADLFDFDILNGLNRKLEKVLIHQTVVEYLVASFVFEIATSEYKDNIITRRISACLADMLAPHTTGCGTEVKSLFWHHDISEVQTSLLPYFFESFLNPILERDQKTFCNSLNSIFADIYSNTVITPKIFELLAELSIEKPMLSKLVICSLGKEFDPLKHIMSIQEGCKLLHYVFRDVTTNSKTDLEQTVNKVNTPVKLIRYLIEKDVLNYCKKDYEMVPAQNGKFSKYQKERIRAVENAFYWKLFALVLKARYSYNISSLTTITTHWFRETESDVSKLEIIMQQQNGTKSEPQLSASVLENYFLAEFVFRMATYGAAIDSMSDSIQIAVKILLNKWTSESSAQFESEITNPFSFLSLIDALLSQHKAKENFIAQIRLEVFGCKEIDKESISDIRKKLCEKYPLLIQNITSCSNTEIGKQSLDSVKPKNVISLFAIAFKYI